MVIKSASHAWKRPWPRGELARSLDVVGQGAVWLRHFDAARVDPLDAVGLE